jgi:hypothetical protein
MKQKITSLLLHRNEKGSITRKTGLAGDLPGDLAEELIEK